MISNPDRRNAVMLINEAVLSGVRLPAACEEMGICKRTYRALRAQDLQHHRGRFAVPVKSTPKHHQASAPNEVWV